MKLFQSVTLIVLMLISVLMSGQSVKYNPANPKAGEIIDLEIDVKIEANASISWTKETGEGDFVGDPINQIRVKFRPTAAGETLVLVCRVKTPDGEIMKRVTIVVAGQQASLTSPAPSPSPQPTVKPPGPAAAPDHHTVDLLISSIESLVPSGWMGDAISENGETAFLETGYTQDCYLRHPSCYHLVYKPGKVGWAAFAWQYVPQGSANWGEYEGLNLSDRNFRSFRVVAKGEPSPSKVLPKVQFKSGGNVAPNSKYPASYMVAGPTVQLTANFQEYCLDLSDKNLRSVISPFTVVVAKANNPDGAGIVFDSMAYSTAPCPAATR